MSAVIYLMDHARTGRRLVAQAYASEVGIRLAAALRVAGMSQADVTRAIGVQSSQVSQWISGRSRPSLEPLLLLLPYLNVTLDYVFIGHADGLPLTLRDALRDAEAAIRAADDDDDSAAPRQAQR